MSECTFCGAPLAHACGPFCSPACMAADADEGPVQGASPRRDAVAWPPF